MLMAGIWAQINTKRNQKIEKLFWKVAEECPHQIFHIFWQITITPPDQRQAYNIVYPHYPQSGENIGIDYAYLQRYSGCTGDKDERSIDIVKLLVEFTQQKRFLTFIFLAANEGKLFIIQKIFVDKIWVKIKVENLQGELGLI